MTFNTSWRLSVPGSQGGAPKRRLPWAELLNAFSVKNEPREALSNGRASAPVMQVREVGNSRYAPSPQPFSQREREIYFFGFTKTASSMGTLCFTSVSLIVKWASWTM